MSRAIGAAQTINGCVERFADFYSNAVLQLDVPGAVNCVRAKQQASSRTPGDSLPEREQGCDAGPLHCSALLCCICITCEREGRRGPRAMGTAGEAVG